jgi:hypothetical protein
MSGEKHAANGNAEKWSATHVLSYDMVSLNATEQGAPCVRNQDPADWADILRGVCASVD